MILLLIPLLHTLDFNQWISKYQPTYNSTEKIRRQAIFQNNIQLSNHLNSQKHHTFTTSVTGPFSDLTNEEYQTRLSPRSTTPAVPLKRTPTIQQSIIGVDHTNLYSAVRNQGNCASGYAHAVIGALEGNAMLKTPSVRNLDLSEQAIIDCSTSANGCTGGTLMNAFDYTRSNGAVPENDYVYTGVKGTCKFDKNKVTIQYDGTTLVPPGEEWNIEPALTKGPCAVWIDASPPSFQLYQSGVYNDSACRSQGNHGAVLVGNGIDGVGYWNVRNSFGANWGINGHIRLARYTDVCGITQQVRYPNNVGPYVPPQVLGKDKVIAYYTNWAQYRTISIGGWSCRYTPDEIDPMAQDIINYAFTIFGEDYKVKEFEWNDDVMIPKVIAKKAQNPKLLVFFSIGGWNFNFLQPTKHLFGAMARSPANRRVFIQSCIDFANKYGFDGIDVDWEYPGNPELGGQPDDKVNFTTLLQLH